ncbi:2164_t:CDS:1, partial [Gigaspora margarita]
KQPVEVEQIKKTAAIVEKLITMLKLVVEIIIYYAQENVDVCCEINVKI